MHTSALTLLTASLSLLLVSLAPRCTPAMRLALNLVGQGLIGVFVAIPAIVGMLD